MRLTGFIGPSNVTRSINVDAEDTINFYPELRNAGTPKVEVALYSTPCVHAWLLLPSGPVRAIFYQDGRAFAVAGAFFYELFATQTAVSRGAVADDGQPATISSNGHGGFQLLVVSGGLGYIFDLTANTLTQITAVSFPTNALMGAFSDGYFFALKAQSSTFHFSDLEDGTSWSGLDTAQVSTASDLVQSMIVDHREIWLFGSKTTTPWYDSGNATTPWQPIPGTLIETGIVAPWSAQKLDNTVLWLGGDERGANMVWRADGYTPRRISTHAIETYLNRLSRTSDAIAYTYQEEGHLFYVLYLPQADHTLVYDVAANLWHKRALWSLTLEQWVPDVGRCHAYAFGKHLLGSRLDGGIYESSLQFTQDRVVA